MHLSVSCDEHKLTNNKLITIIQLLCLQACQVYVFFSISSQTRQNKIKAFIAFHCAQVIQRICEQCDLLCLRDCNPNCAPEQIDTVFVFFLWNFIHPNYLINQTKWRNCETPQLQLPAHKLPAIGKQSWSHFCGIFCVNNEANDDNNEKFKFTSSRKTIEIHCALFFQQIKFHRRNKIEKKLPSKSICLLIQCKRRKKKKETIWSTKLKNLCAIEFRRKEAI